MRIPPLVARVTAAASLAVFASCSSAEKKVRPPKEPHRAEAPTSAAREIPRRGQASWYGKSLHGRRTASGERFDMNALTAAHRTLPFGTRVRVTELKGGKSVEVRINDRGPFARARIIDISFAAAKALGIVSTGTASVEITVLSAREDAT